MAPSTSTNSVKPDDTSNTLSSVVSNLVRASMGTSISPTVTDEDLDRHVAELILREAKKKAEKYGQQGIRAYIASNLQDSNAPRTNKRFLSSIIRSTDDHNKAVLRAQAEAAEEIKRARREEEKRERRLRAEEAVRARKVKDKYRSSKSSSHSQSNSWREEREGEEEEGWDRWDGRTANREKERGKRKVRSWETWEGEDLSVDSDEERIRRKSNRDKDETRKRSRTHENGETRHSRRKARDAGDERKEDEDRRGKRRKDETSPSKPRGEERDGRRRHRRHHRSRSHSRHRSRRNRSGSRSPGRTSDKDKKEERKYTPADLREEESRQASMDERDSKPQRLKSSVVAKEVLSIAGASSSHTPTSYDRRQSPTRVRVQSPSRSHHAGSTSPIRQELQAPHKPSHSKPSSSRNSSHTRSMSLSRSRSSSPFLGPSPPPPNLPSKMDKYFEEHYDPRLDVTPLSTMPNVPATGLVSDADFEGWDAMLELIRVRKQDKEDKKRLERLGIVDKKDKKGKGKEKVVEGSSLFSAGMGGSGSSILDIEYKKRGTVREWDLGKEGVDLSF